MSMNKKLLIASLLCLAASPDGVAGDLIEKNRQIPIGALLDPSSAHYGKKLLVFGYFKMLGADETRQYGRLCLDRESASNNYRPYCLVVEMDPSYKDLAKIADGKFAIIGASAELESIATSYPGKLMDVSRIDLYNPK